jgi:hypothetical protein
MQTRTAEIGTKRNQLSCGVRSLPSHNKCDMIYEIYVIYMIYVIYVIYMIYVI